MGSSDGAKDEIEFKKHRDYIEARFPSGFAVDRFNRFVDISVQACRKRKLSHLLVDLRAIEANVSMIDRYEIATHGADAAADIKVALIALPMVIDPKKFGVQVARNRGLTIDIFTERKPAIAWLLAPKKP
jgi:hypothetical protein